MGREYCVTYIWADSCQVVEIHARIYVYFYVDFRPPLSGITWVLLFAVTS